MSDLETAISQTVVVIQHNPAQRTKVVADAWAKVRDTLPLEDLIRLCAIGAEMDRDAAVATTPEELRARAETGFVALVHATLDGEVAPGR